MAGAASMVACFARQPLIFSQIIVQAVKEKVNIDEDQKVPNGAERSNKSSVELLDQLQVPTKTYIEESARAGLFWCLKCSNAVIYIRAYTTDIHYQ